MKERGLGYWRVSADDQVRGASLGEQDRAGRRWFADRGIACVRTFTEEGQSARSRNRTELRAAFDFIRDERRAGRRIDVFLVNDLSRFTRNLEDQLAIKRELAALGCRLDSVMMPLREDAHGKAAQGMFGVINQFDSDLKSEKVAACMLARTREGNWLHPAPLGYRNRRTEDGARKWIEPDPVLGPIVAAAFRAVADGARLVDALASATAGGLRGRIAGGRVLMKTFRAMLQHPIYAGKVRSNRHGFTVDGQHEPLVDAGTFQRVQARLRPGPGGAAPRVKENADFPLRGFVRCEHCGSPLTAAWTRGKSGGRYAYFSCWKDGCKKVRVAGRVLEDTFCAELDRRRVDVRLLPLLELACRERAKERENDRATASARASRRLVDLRVKRERLIDAFVYERALSRELYDGQMQRLEREIAEAEFQLMSPAEGARDVADMLALAKPMLTAPAALWLGATYGLRRALQAFVFPSGATYGPEGLRTPEVRSLFSGLQPNFGEEGRMVAPAGRSSNPIDDLLEVPDELLAHLVAIAPPPAAAWGAA